MDPRETIEDLKKQLAKATKENQELNNQYFDLKIEVLKKFKTILKEIKNHETKLISLCKTREEMKEFIKEHF